jgi:predicted DNA-binding transcriptional regulator YafY
MSYKFDALITILNKLDRRERVTAKSLMEEFEVGERTIYRYLDTLLSAGFPVTFDKEKRSYVFDEGYALRRADLALEEILAFSLAKKLLGNFGPGMEKILGAMEGKLAIKNTEVPRDIVLSPEEQPAKVGDFLVSIHGAVLEYQRLVVIYKALSTDELTERKVDPYYLFFQGGFWHLRAYCHLRKDFRTFALDKIISLRIVKEHFVPERVSQEEDLSGSFAAFKSR